MGRLNKAKWCLLGCLIVVVVLMAGAVFAPSRLTNTVHRVASNDFACKLRGLPQHRVGMEYTLIEMVVDSVAVSGISHQPVVILKEKDNEVYLPIWIGFIEANAISVTLEGVETPRPLTPDLLCSIMDLMCASVDHIVINDLQNDTFYANITVSANWMQTEIDARPSDAIAVALRTGAPIYVEKAILEKAGIQPEYETW